MLKLSVNLKNNKPWQGLRSDPECDRCCQFSFVCRFLSSMFIYRSAAALLASMSRTFLHNKCLFMMNSHHKKCSKVLWLPDYCIIFGGECLVDLVQLFGGDDIDLWNNSVLVAEVNTALMWSRETLLSHWVFGGQGVAMSVCLFVHHLKCYEGHLDRSVSGFFRLSLSLLHGKDRA